MATLELPYVQEYFDNRGKLRLYFRRRGYAKRTLRGPVGSIEFLEDYDAAIKQLPAPKPRPGEASIAAGTIADLLARYYQSTQYKQLKPSTQGNYRRNLDRFQETALPNGSLVKDAPLAGLKRSHLLTILDGKSETPGAVYTLLKRLKTVFDFAIERDMIKENPAKGIRQPKLGGIRQLDEPDIGQYLQYWAPGTRQRRAIIVLLYTGQRRSDAVRMGLQHIKDGRISVTQEKTGKRLEIQIHPVLQAEIDSMPAGQMMFITGERGTPFTAASFGNMFRQWCKDAGLPEHSSPHGCRKAAGRRLAEAGCTAHEIMSILGHESLSEAERYTKSADQITMGDSAIAKLK